MLTSIDDLRQLEEIKNRQLENRQAWLWIVANMRTKNFLQNSRGLQKSIF